MERRRLIFALFLLSFVETQSGNDQEIPSQEEYLAQKDSDKEMEKLHEKDHKQIKNELRQDILEQYGVDIDFKHAPIDAMHERLNVSVLFYLVRILDIDENDQRLLLYGQLELIWQDTTLEWDPSQYDNLTMIRIHPESAWIPPVNAGDALWTHRVPKPDLTVGSEGYTSYSSYVTIRSHCPKMDYGSFPFDQHNCTVSFYVNNMGTGESVVLQPYTDYYAVFRGHGFGKVEGMAAPSLDQVYSLKWKILGGGVQQKDYGGSEPKEIYFSLAHFWVSFVRRSPYFSAQFVFPLLLSSSFLFVSWIYPLQHKGRLWMICASVVALTLTLLQLYNTLPAASFTTPKIVRFSLLVWVLELLCLLESVILPGFLHHFKSSLPPPIWITNIADTVATLLCYREHKKHEAMKADDEVLLMEGPSCESQSEWRRVVSLVDRLVFVMFMVIYLLAIIILLL